MNTTDEQTTAALEDRRTLTDWMDPRKWARVPGDDGDWIWSGHGHVRNMEWCALEVMRNRCARVPRKVEVLTRAGDGWVCLRRVF
ncbi:MAG: hypothetical protein GY851_26560 [bacterium]|nr:hypothetical protein [bacterium]